MSDDLEILLKASIDDDNKLITNLNKQIADLSLKLNPIKIGIDLSGALEPLSSEKLKIPICILLLFFRFVIYSMWR